MFKLITIIHSFWFGTSGLHIFEYDSSMCALFGPLFSFLCLPVNMHQSFKYKYEYKQRINEWMTNSMLAAARRISWLLCKFSCCYFSSPWKSLLVFIPLQDWIKKTTKVEWKSIEWKWEIFNAKTEVRCKSRWPSVHLIGQMIASLISLRLIPCALTLIVKGVRTDLIRLLACMMPDWGL